MAIIVAAGESSVQVNGQPVEGVRTFDYRTVRSREPIYGLGSSERIGLVDGPAHSEGRLSVASSNATLDGVGAAVFQVIATLRQGDTAITVTFDECHLLEKTFDLSVGGYGEATYRFSAIRVREEVAAAA